MVAGEEEALDRRAVAAAVVRKDLAPGRGGGLELETARPGGEVAGNEDRVDALYVREVRTGPGLRTRARNFERSFYDATCIDGLRVFRKSLLERAGGFDETLFACEDWDLDRRVLALGARTALTDRALLHDERRLSLPGLLRKKRYYAGSFDAYRRKWGNDATVRRQFGLGYRFFGVFLENGKWRRVLRHPILFAAVMLERFAVGMVFLLARPPRRAARRPS